MNTVTLGMTGLKVSPIAFGAWQLGGEWGEFDEQQAVAAIRQARELGVNLFDTAQGYGFGASEQLLGRALRDDLDKRRDDVVIATKGGLRMTDDGVARDASPGFLRGGVEDSLRSLGVDYVDIYQVHWPDPNVPFTETAAALEELVQEGKIRHVGVSNYDVAQMTEFARIRPVETLQPPYHLFRRDIEAGVLPYVHEHDIGVLVYGPLAHGLLTGSMDEQTTFATDDWRSQLRVRGRSLPAQPEEGQ
jgi:aryl-alcohol dehydrogenase-like predicted oxidoreductase